MTLRMRLMLLVLLAMLPALVLIVDSTIDQYRHLKDDAEQTSLKLARIAVSYHDSLIEETRHMLSYVADMPAVRELDPRACSRLLHEVLQGDPHLTNLGVIAPDGWSICSGVPVNKSFYLGDRGYFQAVLRSKRPSIGDYQIGRLTNKPVQVVAMPLLDERQQVKAVVYAALNLDGLTRFTPLSELPPGSAVLVVDRHGVILARAPDPQNRWTGTRLDKAARFAEGFTLASENSWIKTSLDVDGVERIYAIARLNGDSDRYGYIMIGTPAQALHDTIKSHLLPHLAFIGIVFPAILLLAWFGSDILVLKRTRLLTQAAQRLGSGDLGARASVSGRDEIAQLADAFNRTGDKLERENLQIRRLNRIHEVLSGINGAILRVRERKELAAEACRIAVERGGLRFAWIGLADEDGRLQKIAAHGEGKQYLLKHCLGPEASAGKESYPCHAALSQNRAVVHNDIGSGDQAPEWIGAALAQGFRSLAAFPLHGGGRAIGVIGLYSDEARFFDAPETDLFLELAADISLGLEYIDKDQRIAHMLYHDVLTGLPNRRLCEDRLQQAIARMRHHDRYIGVLVLNITDFHRVVGVYGHHVADELLNLIARHLLAQVRDGDTVARLEGDEFAVLLVDAASRDDVIHLAQNLVQSLPGLVRSGEREIHLAIRTGAAIYPNDGSTAAGLLGCATLACNSGKGNQGHRLNFYSAEIQQLASDREKFEQALRHAINADEGFELHYQPVVDIASYRIISLEALLRWNSAELGSVTPSRFIPVAEETGLIIPLGNWVLDAACRQIMAWRRLGLDAFRVAVNVSFQQMNRSDFLERLFSKAASNPATSQLAIELTETELMDNIEMTVRQIELLKQHDLAIYIDDFGTGYSSLSQLQRLPVDILKIDRSFVGTLGQSESSAEIVRTINALAKSLKLKTIAEGVETAEQLAMLQQLGCDYAQGYLFSKPRPADEITRLLDAGSPLTPAS
ncbi:MAG: EAL domain-containing protein [Pseudomonadota bacterium]